MVQNLPVLLPPAIKSNTRSQGARSFATCPCWWQRITVTIKLDYLTLRVEFGTPLISAKYSTMMSAKRCASDAPNTSRFSTCANTCKADVSTLGMILQPFLNNIIDYSSLSLSLLSLLSLSNVY